MLMCAKLIALFAASDSSWCSLQAPALVQLCWMLICNGLLHLHVSAMLQTDFRADQEARVMTSACGGWPAGRELQYVIHCMIHTHPCCAEGIRALAK